MFKIKSLVIRAYFHFHCSIVQVSVSPCHANYFNILDFGSMWFLNIQFCSARHPVKQIVLGL